MAPSCTKLGQRAAQRSRVSQLGKQRRRRQDCSPIFPQKQAEGVDQEPQGSDLLFPNQGLHLWLTTEARGLNLGFSAAQAQREGCCSLSKGGRGKWGLGGAREEGGRLHQRLLDAAGLQAISLA